MTLSEITVEKPYLTNTTPTIQTMAGEEHPTAMTETPPSPSTAQNNELKTGVVITAILLLAIYLYSKK